MKVGIYRNDKFYIKIKYEENEWEELERKLIGLGLQKRETKNGWGMEIPLVYYREENEELRRYFQTHLPYRVFDNINDPPIVDGTINLAIFRVCPNSDKEVIIPTNYFISVSEFEKLVSTLRRLYELIFNIIETELEVKITKITKKFGEENNV